MKKKNVDIVAEKCDSTVGDDSSFLSKTELPEETSASPSIAVRQKKKKKNLTRQQKREKRNKKIRAEQAAKCDPNVKGGDAEGGNFLLNIDGVFDEPKPSTQQGQNKDKTGSNSVSGPKRKNRKRVRRDKDGNETKAKENRKAKKMKRLVSHFVAIQVNKAEVVKQVKEIQEKILAYPVPLAFAPNKNPGHRDYGFEEPAAVFKDAMERLDSLHLTMGVIGITGDEEIQKAVGVVESCWNKHKSSLESNPLDLNILGVGHFANRVLFAKVQDQVHISRLESLATDLRSEFQNMEIFQAKNPFQAHMTIAKVSRSKTLHKKKIRSFPPEIWTDHELHCFGQQPVQSLQLLEMTRDANTNYYKMVAEFKL